MPWTYHQNSGAMEAPDRTLLATGYSGFGQAKNNGDAEYMAAGVYDSLSGPIPRGTYFIRGAYASPVLGPVTIPLTPAASNEMFGRSGFMIHGDSLTDPGDASRGCIVLDRTAREAIDKSADKILEVVR
jgi:hypothetical protein